MFANQKVKEYSTWTERLLSKTLCCEKDKAGGGEMARWVKCLPCEHKNMSIHAKAKRGSNLLGTENQISGAHWTDNQAEKMSSRFREKTRRREIEKNIWHQLLTFTLLVTHVHACTYTCIQIHMNTVQVRCINTKQMNKQTNRQRQRKACYSIPKRKKNTVTFRYSSINQLRKVT